MLNSSAIVGQPAPYVGATADSGSPGITPNFIPNDVEASITYHVQVVPITGTATTVPETSS